MAKEIPHLRNMDKNFENPVRYVLPLGLLVTPNLVLKKYDMYTSFSSSIAAVKSMDRFLIKEIEKGRIDPKLGFGFSILSKDMLNIVRWDDKYPIVAVNSLYEFSEEDRDFMKPTPLSVDKFGAYCVWELDIVNHEKNAWMDYLNSKQDYEDKIRYFNNFIKGKLNDRKGR